MDNRRQHAKTKSMFISIQKQRQLTYDQQPLANDLEASENIILQQIWRYFQLNYLTKIIPVNNYLF